MNEWKKTKVHRATVSISVCVCASVFWPKWPSLVFASIRLHGHLGQLVAFTRGQWKANSAVRSHVQLPVRIHAPLRVVVLFGPMRPHWPIRARFFLRVSLHVFISLLWPKTIAIPSYTFITLPFVTGGIKAIASLYFMFFGKDFYFLYFLLTIGYKKTMIIVRKIT